MSNWDEEQRNDTERTRATVHAVARVLGCECEAEPESRTGCALTLGPGVVIGVHLVSYPRPRHLHWYATHTTGRGNRPSVNTALDRAPEAIAADLRRRLIPDARKWCLDATRLQGLELDKKRAREHRLEMLKEILGPAERSYSSGRDLLFAGFWTAEHDITGNWEGNYRAEINVTSWHAFEAIAKIVAEDQKQKRLRAERKKELQEAAGGVC